jgi:hypothetical protein
MNDKETLMRRRSIVLIAGGILALAFASPVFGDSMPSAPRGNDGPAIGAQAPTTTTTAPPAAPAPY